MGSAGGGSTVGASLSGNGRPWLCQLVIDFSDLFDGAVFCFAEGSQGAEEVA